MDLSSDSRTIDLWCTYISEIGDESLWLRYDALLGADERARQARFRFAKDQRRYLVTRALVRTVLSRYAAVRPEEWTFSAGAHGRPAIAGPGAATALEFNISHSADLVMLGVTSGRTLGIDVESFETRDADISGLDRYFAAEESASLLSLAPHERRRRFFELWTLKESYIKARGMGLSIPLNQFSFGLEEAHSVAVSFDPLLQDAPQRWHFWQFDIGPAHLAAACAQVGSRAPFMCARRLIPCVSEKPLYVGIRRNSANLSELAELITKRR